MSLIGAELSTADPAIDPLLEKIKCAAAVDPIMIKLKNQIIAGFLNDRCNLDFGTIQRLTVIHHCTNEKKFPPQTAKKY